MVKAWAFVSNKLRFSSRSADCQKGSDLVQDASLLWTCFLIYKVGRMTSLTLGIVARTPSSFTGKVVSTCYSSVRPWTASCCSHLWSGTVSASLTSGCLPQCPFVMGLHGCSDLGSRLSMLLVLRLKYLLSRSTLLWDGPTSPLCESSWESLFKELADIQTLEFGYQWKHNYGSCSWKTTCILVLTLQIWMLWEPDLSHL